MIVKSDLYERAVDKYGKSHQIMVLVEEMAECTAQISKYFNRGRGTEEEVVDEIADVSILISQMSVVYGQNLVNSINRKLNKLKGHIDGK